MKKMSLVLSVFVLTAVLLSACQYNVRRNGDGTASVETTISQQEVQDAVSAAIADPLVQNVTVSLQSGYVLVTGERQRLNDNSKTDALSFRLDLGVSDGHLTATLSDALLDGAALDQARVDGVERAHLQPPGTDWAAQRACQPAGGQHQPRSCDHDLGHQPLGSQ
jgi:hypothetical protein